MTVLLAPHDVTVEDDRDVPDEHGWMQVTVPSVLWTGKGNLRPQDETGDGAAAEPGGAGPADPDVLARAVVRLPIDAPVHPGLLIRVDGTAWRVTSAALSSDPTGSGWLDCWRCQVVEVR